MYLADAVTTLARLEVESTINFKKAEIDAYFSAHCQRMANHKIYIKT